MIMPIRQTCPTCMQDFMGSDAIGDECPRCAQKDELGLPGRRRTSATPMPVETTVKRWLTWIAGTRGVPTPQIWFHPKQSHDGVPVKFITQYELPKDEDATDLDLLARKYPVIPTETKKAISEYIDDHLGIKPDSKVSLIDYTGAGSSDPDYAINLLLFTKETRLKMTVHGLSDITHAWPKGEKMKSLEYMANTIPSSWEFVDYTFMIERVTRAFTHQFVRSRHCSFAQQTMRILDMSSGPGWEYGTGPTISSNPVAKEKYDAVMKNIADQYHELTHGAGVTIEDARGILPTNILTNIVAKMNMRTFVELVRKRSSPRVQGEYRTVLEQMQQEVRKVHPWIDLFINRTFEQAAKELDGMIKLISDDILRTKMLKLVDQMRAQS